MKQVKQIHAQMVSIGLVHNGYSVGKLLCFCAFSLSGSLNYANLIFSQSDRSNTFLWNTMIIAHSGSSVPKMGIIFYNQMLGEGNVADKYTYPFAIRACARVGAIAEGRVIHGRVLLVGLNVDDFISSSLLNFYADCGLMAASHQVFDETPHRDVMWTALVVGYAQCRELGTALHLFDEMPERNLVSWNAMINGHVQSGCFKEALNLFQELQGICLKPNDATLTSVLSACTHLGALDQASSIKHQASLSSDSSISIYGVLSPPRPEELVGFSSALGKRRGKKILRGELKTGGFWQDVSKPTSIDMEEITGMEQPDMILQQAQ